MDSKELRIGSYISRMDLGDNHLRVEQILELREESVLTTGPIKVKCKYSEIQPIPLTEEWLLNLGFTLHSGLWYFSVEKLIQLNLDLESKIFYIDAPCVHDGGFRVNNIEFFHQLQNLWFTLTGEELIIKN